MKSLIIGGSGFIGRNIIDLLNRKGHYTVSYDIAKKDNDANDHIKGNISDFNKLNISMKDIDYVFNLAAVTSPPEFEDIDSNGYEINVMGTYNILKAAFKNNVKKVILASSSAVYGNIDVPAKEDRFWRAPKFPKIPPESTLRNQISHCVKPCFQPFLPLFESSPNYSF